MGQEAVPGMPWRDIAASAYRAYAASTGNKNYQGLPMPAFDDLPQAIKTAWEAAARQVGECIRSGSRKPPSDESRWAGWVPPHLKQIGPYADMCAPGMHKWKSKEVSTPDVHEWETWCDECGCQSDPREGDGP